MTSNGRMHGKVAVVVGAGSSDAGMGIGQAIALLLAQEGARMILVDLEEERATETGRMITEAGGQAIAVGGDIALEETCARAITAGVETYGTITTLVNNAAYTPLVGVAETSPELFTRVLAVNTLGPFMMARAALPSMVAGGGGSIVNVGSLSAIRSGDGRQAAYASSKAALLGLMVDVANEYGPQNVRINTVSPGMIDTPLRRKTMREMGYDPDTYPYGEQAALRRAGDPWDIARAVLFLASDDAQFISGVHLPVDGGISTRRPS